MQFLLQLEIIVLQMISLLGKHPLLLTIRGNVLSYLIKLLKKVLILFNTFAELPEAYKAFAPTVDVLPLIPLFFFLLVFVWQAAVGFK